MHWRRYLVPILVLVLLGTWFASSGGTAHAAPYPGMGYQYTVRTGTWYSWHQMSAAQGFGPATIEAEGSFSLSSSYSASVGINVSLVNATVGFNVQTTVTRGGACYVSPPPGVEGWVQLYALYYVVGFNIYWHNGVTGVNTYQGYGSGQQFSYFQCESQINSPGGT